MTQHANIAVLASGGGTNFQAIAESCRKGELKAVVKLLVVNRPCGAVKRAQQLRVPNLTLSPNDFIDEPHWDQALLTELQNQQIDYVILAGFLKKIGPQVLKAYENKIINIHPSLLPKFGGMGMYGIKVHQAVFLAGCEYSGSTVHYVTENYDEGPIIAQSKVSLRGCKNASEVSERVTTIENQFFVESLKSIFNQQ